MSFRFILLTFLLFAQLNVIAQRPEGGRQNVPYDERPAIGTLFGSTWDSTAGESLPYAGISLHLLKGDSLVGGVMADGKGKFRLTEVKAGRYNLKINFLGYDEIVIADITVSPKQPTVDLGKIMVKQNAIQLKEAEVKGEKRFMVVDIDKKTYDVSKNIISEGGDATQVLRNIPSVDVDIDGNVSLRGSENVRILIDGKPSALTGGSRRAILEQIPAAMIDKIEVITNPSAKYDPEGTAGIINVVLKKNSALGFNGSVSGGVGTFYKYNASTDLNLRTNKYNIFASASKRYDDGWFTGRGVRNNFFGDTTTVLEEISTRTQVRENNMARLGAEFYLTPLTNLSFSGTYNNSPSTSLRSTLYNNYSNGDSMYSNQNILTFTDAKSDGYSGELFFDHTFDATLERKISMEAAYSQSDQLSDANLHDWFLSEDQGFTKSYATNLTLVENSIVRVKIDFETKLPGAVVIEAGARSDLQNIRQDLVYFSPGTIEQDWVADSTRSNDFIYAEDIHAAYFIIGKESKFANIKAGLRAEQAFTESRLATDTSVWVNNYFRLYPSVHISRSLGQDEELMLSYSRRVDRPSMRSLNPFHDYSDPLNLRIGNPNLRPESINSFEIGYSKYWESGTSITGTLYYRYLTDIIRRFRTVDEITNISTSTFVNLNTAQSFGLELIFMTKIAKWWSIQASSNAFQTIIDGDNVQTDLVASGWGLNAKFNNQFRFSDRLEGQASGDWRAPSITTQGRRAGRFTVDAAIKLSFSNNRASLGLRVSDVFDTRMYQYFTNGEGFTSDGKFKRQSQIAYLTFTYKFGKQQRRNSKRPSRTNGSLEEFNEE